MSKNPLFSVFTPTYNRRHTLHRAYESLMAQTFRDFEWIIIDDGSTDGTEELVRKWQQEAPFVIHYHWQPNQGKHIAYNHCARVATGELFVNIDSDDEALPTALERFNAIWTSFTNEEKHTLMAALCHCQDEQGNLIGKVFGKEGNADMVEYLLRIPNHGEKWGFMQTRVLREFPFPEEVKNVHIPESYFMHQSSQFYKVRFVNEKLRIYYIEENNNSLTRQLNSKENIPGTYYANLAFPKFSMRLFHMFPKTFFANTVYFIKAAASLKKGLIVQWKDIGNTRGRILWVFSLPAGYMLFLKEKFFDRTRNS